MFNQNIYDNNVDNFKFKDKISIDRNSFIDLLINEFVNISEETNTPLKDINLKNILEYYTFGNGQYSDKISVIRFYK